MRTLKTLAFILLGVSASYGQKFTLQDSVVKKGDVLISYSVCFELNKADLRPESFSFLDSIAIFLLDHKSLTLEVSDHCDERWSDLSASCLTCERAKTIADYLILKGVKSDRLVAIGYNDRKPIIKDAKTKEEHQKNRRTEFKIVKQN